MIRNFLSILAGLLVTTLFIVLILYFGWSIYPLPEKVSWFVPSTYKHLSINIYPGTYFFEILAYTISAFFGGITVAYLVKTAKTAYAMFIGLILFIFVMVKFFLIHHPFWFNILAPLPILPMGFIGGSLIEKSCKKSTNNNQ